MSGGLIEGAYHILLVKFCFVVNTTTLMIMDVMCNDIDDKLYNDGVCIVRMM